MENLYSIGGWSSNKAHEGRGICLPCKLISEMMLFLSKRLASIRSCFVIRLDERTDSYNFKAYDGLCPTATPNTPDLKGTKGHESLRKGTCGANMTHSETRTRKIQPCGLLNPFLLETRLLKTFERVHEVEHGKRCALSKAWAWREDYGQKASASDKTGAQRIPSLACRPFTFRRMARPYKRLVSPPPGNFGGRWLNLSSC